MNIKTTIGIIAIVLSSATMAEAGEKRHAVGNGHHYNQEKQTHYRQTHKRVHQERRHYQPRHYRQHYYDRHNRYQRSHGYYSNSRYIRNITPQIYSHTVVISGRGHSNRALPIIAGGVIGSVIANNASGGDSAATFGGAVFGAIIGSALSHH